VVSTMSRYTSFFLYDVQGLRCATAPVTCKDDSTLRTLRLDTLAECIAQAPELAAAPTPLRTRCSYKYAHWRAGAVNSACAAARRAPAA
jgi:hypothetical protein